jgi:ubiquinol-cytochrome c reductase cytochrome b subunit
MNAKSSRLIKLLALEAAVDRLRSLKVHDDTLNWTRFCGALLVILIVLLFLSGIFMAFYYSPVPGAAYDSVDFALFNVPFGGIVKGVHHYAWNLLLIFLGIHLFRAFIVGAYKAPRQMVWISGVLVMLLVPLFIITGDLLPWDQKGYWSTQVRLSIISSIPFIGDLLVRLLQGGSLTGVVALTRFYILHIMLLPGLLIFLIAVHFYFIYQCGITGPLNQGTDQRVKTSFFPNILNRWLFLFLIVSVILGLIGWYWTAPLGDPADPTDSSYVPRPEWWVLFLNQLVTIFKGNYTIVGSMIIPGGLIGLLFALPVIDRSPGRHPIVRWKLMLASAVITIFIIGLSIMGYVEHFVRAAH